MSRRLLASYLTLAVVVLLALEIPLAVSFTRSEQRELTTKVERDAVAMASLVEDTLEGSSRLDAATAARLASRYASDTGGRVVVVDTAGLALVDSSGNGAGRSFASRPELAAALAGRVATGIRHSDTLSQDLLYVAVPVASSGVVHGAVRITYPASEIAEREHRYWAILAAIGAVVLTAATLVGLRFARSIAGPLGRLEAAAGRAGAGDLTVRAPVGGPPEVRSLAISFNDMVGQLDQLVRAQREFVADASHQLRTPLAALRLRLENLEHDVAAGGREGLAAALTEVARLSHLVDGLLALARAAAMQRPREAVDLSALVEQRVVTWAPLGAERDVSIEASVQPGAIALAMPGALEQVLDNLLQNALAVSPAGGSITVCAAPVGDRVELRVIDEGPGLTDEERARAFDRFWRSDAKGAAGGSGLGLTIVRGLVESDHGTIELGRAASGGVEVAVRLPRGK